MDIRGWGLGLFVCGLPPLGGARANKPSRCFVCFFLPPINQSTLVATIARTAAAHPWFCLFFFVRCWVRSYKIRFDLPPTRQKVVAVPDVSAVSRAPGHDDFVLLACDGVWDVMTAAAAAKLVFSLLLVYNDYFF